MLKRGFQFAPGYRLQEFLGRGQFGQVWRASAPGGAAAAVKFIDLSDGQGQKEYDAVRRVKQIRHANLMPITAIWLLDAQGQVIDEAPDEALETIDLSVSEAPGQSAVYPPDVTPSWLVVAMLLGGKSLHHRLQECIGDGLAGIPPKELIAYMDEAAKGLDFLNKPQHDLGEGPIAIQHCDVKPANIVLIGSSAVVCDFGLARILSRNQVTATSPSGTPAYMAPEAISGKPSRTSDQYSLAVTYYHLRTGGLPVNDGSVWEVLDAHRLGKLNLAGVSEREQIVLRKATELNWQNRFPSNMDFVEALREALRADGSTAPSFVPMAAETSKLSSAPTAPLQVAPKETIDALAGETKPHDALAATAHSIPITPAAATGHVATQAAASEVTLPDAGQHTEAFASEVSQHSWVHQIRQHPKAVAGVAVAAAALIGLTVLFNGNASSSASQEQQGVGQDSRDQQTGLGQSQQLDAAPPPDKSASEFLAEALALVDRDFDGATEMYQQAIARDPGLAPEPMRLSSQDSGPIVRMRVTPDGRWLISMADGPALSLRKLADLQSPAIQLQGHDRLLNAYAVDSSGTRLLTGGFDSEARVWNLRSASPAESPQRLTGLQGSVEAVAWNPQQPLAWAASSAMQLGWWQLEPDDSLETAGSIQQQRQLDIGRLITQLTVDPTADWMAALSIGSDLLSPEPDVLIYACDDLRTAEGSPAPLSLKAKQAKRIAFLQRQSEPTLAIGEVGGSVALYAIGAENKLIQRLEPASFNGANHIEAMVTVATPSGDVILAGSSEGSVLWWQYADSNQHQWWHVGKTNITDVDLSSDGRWAAAGTGKGSVWLWDTSAGEGHGAIEMVTHSGTVDSIRLDPTSRWLIAGCDDGAIRLWDLRHLKLMTSAARTKAIRIDQNEDEEQGTGPHPKLTMHR